MIPYPLLTIIHFHPQILTCNLFHMYINSVLGNIKLLLIPLPCTLSRNEGKNTEHGNIVDVGDREVYSHQVKVEARANNIKEKWKTSNTIFTFTRCEYSLMLNQTTNYSVSQHHVSKIPTSKCSTRRLQCGRHTKFGEATHEKCLYGEQVVFSNLDFWQGILARNFSCHLKALRHRR